MPFCSTNWPRCWRTLRAQSSRSGCQKVIDAYNSGATATENYYDELTAYADGLRAEAERHIREGLTEDELELFDLLKKDAMTQKEAQSVKLARSAY